MGNDVSVAEPLPSTNELALERNRLAYDRTMMAWVRTATSLISFGFTIYKFFEYVNQSGQTATQRRIGPREYGMLMIITGVIVLAIATFPAALISVLGLVALIAVWLRF